nr:nucleolar protein 8 [Polyrhizophydium stewartii]
MPHRGGHSPRGPASGSSLRKARPAPGPPSGPTTPIKPENADKKEAATAAELNAAPVSKRLFVGGVAPEVTPEELGARFAAFGQVSGVAIESKAGADGGRFAYLSIETTVGSLKKCYSIYNGTKWRGHALRIEEAKQHYLVRLHRERDETRRCLREGPKVSKKKLRRRAVQVAEDLTPVTNETAPAEWVKARYDRLLPKMKVRHPIRRRIMTVDPSKNKQTFRRFELEAFNRPVATLVLEYNPPADLAEKCRKRSANWTAEELAYKAPKLSDAASRKRAEAEARLLPSDKKPRQRYNPVTGKVLTEEEAKLRFERKSLLNVAKYLFEEDDDEGETPNAGTSADQTPVAADAAVGVVSFTDDEDNVPTASSLARAMGMGAAFDDDDDDDNDLFSGSGLGSRASSGDKRRKPAPQRPLSPELFDDASDKGGGHEDQEMDPEEAERVRKLALFDDSDDENHAPGVAATESSAAGARSHRNALHSVGDDAGAVGTQEPNAALPVTILQGAKSSSSSSSSAATPSSDSSSSDSSSSLASSDSSDSESGSGDGGESGQDAGGDDSDGSGNSDDGSSSDAESDNGSDDDESSSSDSDSEDERKAAGDAEQSAVDLASHGYQINTNLRSMLFAPTGGTFGLHLFSFSLFGAASADDVGDMDVDAEPRGATFDLLGALRGAEDDDGSDDAMDDDAGADASAGAATFSTSKFFFPHSGNAKLAHRSFLTRTESQAVAADGEAAVDDEPETDLFHRTETMQVITKRWEDSREAMTDEFKRKHRSMSKRSQKMRRK